MLILRLAHGVRAAAVYPDGADDFGVIAVCPEALLLLADNDSFRSTP